MALPVTLGKQLSTNIFNWGSSECSVLRLELAFFFFFKLFKWGVDMETLDKVGTAKKGNLRL